MFNILLTSVLTILGGVLVFGFSEIIQKFLVEPVHEQAKVIGEIFFGIVYYGDRYANPGTGPPKAIAETADAFRLYASRLEGTTHAIRWYCFFECIRLVPKRGNVEEAVGNLIRISNSIYTGNGRENSNDADNVKMLLTVPKLRICLTWRSPRT